jgi:CheY-like chemotaxis protein
MTDSIHQRPDALKGDPSEAPEPPRLMVLHVDDEPINRRVLQELLRALGHVGFQAESAPRALELARLAAFDLILMDIHMPGMTGIEAVRALKASIGPERAIPVVAVTADVVSLTLADCREWGFCGLLTKPVSLGALNQVIEQAWAYFSAECREAIATRTRDRAILLSPAITLHL